jgi:hypothetical protein
MRQAMISALVLALAGATAVAQPLRPESKPFVPPVAGQSQWLPFSLFGDRECKRQPVFQINAVTLAAVKGRIEVQVEAVADTALWTDAVLVARPARPPSRMLELEFVACPPRGFVVQVLAPISVRQLIDAAPGDVDVVTVRGRTNAMNARVKDLPR